MEPLHVLQGSIGLTIAAIARNLPRSKAVGGPRAAPDKPLGFEGALCSGQPNPVQVSNSRYLQYKKR